MTRSRMTMVAMSAISYTAAAAPNFILTDTRKDAGPPNMKSMFISDGDDCDGGGSGQSGSDISDGQIGDSAPNADEAAAAIQSLLGKPDVGTEAAAT